MLTAIRKTEIENTVNQILQKYNVTACPAKELKRIMEGEDILFFEDVFDDDNFDGLLIKNNNDQFCIYVNTQINFKPRHNFTIAHELGHYFLKHELKDGSLICNRYGISENNSEDNDNLEQEANYFAANLLMPINLFYKSYVKIMEKIRFVKSK